MMQFSGLRGQYAERIVLYVPVDAPLSSTISLVARKPDSKGTHFVEVTGEAETKPKIEVQRYTRESIVPKSAGMVIKI